jgi:iron complex outermembrane receptor protein
MCNGQEPQSLHHRWIVTVLACALGGVQGVASAAEPAGDKLEEVVVTAQKRAEPLQKTPIAITAMTTRELEYQRVDNLMNLASKIPSLNIVPFTANRAAPNLSIRGMGNTDSQTTKDNAMGIYIDGVPVGRGVGLAADIADLERIEVLRGPQGALYGRNTTSGAINFITIKPEKDFSFEQGLTFGSDDLFASKTRINAPLTEQLFSRLSYMRSSKDGWVKNTNTALPNQVDFNEDDKEAAKLALRLLAVNNFTADLGIDYSKMTYGNIFFQRVAGPTAVTGRQESALPVQGLTPSKTRVEGQNLTLGWQLDHLVLKSITGVRKMSNRTHQDYINIFTQDYDQTQDQLSQEFQAVGDALDRRVEYVAGLFYFKENGDEQVRSVYPAGRTDMWRVQAESTSTALYGQLSWKPAMLEDRLRLTLGARQTHDERSATKQFIISDMFPAAAGMVVPGNKRFKKFTPTYTADYTFSDTVSGYAKIANGYRAGGFNTRSTIDGFRAGFNPERVRSTEAGVKSDLFDRKLRLNAALFHSKYADLQVDQQRALPIFTDTLNAGKASVKGAELELTALLARGLTTNLFYTWLDAKYDSYVDNGVDYAIHRHMPNSPKGQGGAGLRYEGERMSWGRLSASLDYKWQSEFYAGPKHDTWTNGYGIWNARVGLADIRLPQGKLRVALWGKNLADKEYRLATTNLGVISAQFGEPRTLGIDAIYEY